MIKLFVFLQAATPDALQDALKVLTDGLAGGDVVLMVGGGLLVTCLLAALVAKLVYKKELPFVDPLVEVVIGLLRKVRPASPPPKSSQDASGVAGVIPVKKDQESQK